MLVKTPRGQGIAKLRNICPSVGYYLVTVLALELVDESGLPSQYISKGFTESHKVVKLGTELGNGCLLNPPKIAQDNLILELQHSNSPQSWHSNHLSFLHVFWEFQFPAIKQKELCCSHQECVGLEAQFSCWKPWLIFHRSQVRFPALTLQLTTIRDSTSRISDNVF